MTPKLLAALSEIDESEYSKRDKDLLKLMLVEVWRDGHDAGYTEGATAGREFRRA